MDAILQHPLFSPVVIILVLMALFPLVASYLVHMERKVLADFQVRLGPMRVGPHGLLQPIADAVKLLTKEDLIPGAADRSLFWAAPVISTFTALTAMAVIPFSSYIYVTDVNVGILIVTAMSAVGILGIIFGGWSSNSHYSLLGALRSAAQLVSYEVALALALISGIMMTGTLSMVGIVNSQQQKGVWTVFDNFGLMIVPFVIFMIAAVAEVNRAPFDLPEAESELVAGFHTEYSGMRWGLFFLAEYANIVVVSAVAVTLFWGGWLRPFPNVEWLAIPMNYGIPVLLFVASGLGCLPLARRLPHAIQRPILVVVGIALAGIGLLFLIPAINEAVIGLFWFMVKVVSIVYLLIWFRGTFPRFRYDQLMNLGWRYLIPLGMIMILLNAVVGMLRAGS
jgi:NADH-quinone oxidoreductase subunit H